MEKETGWRSLIVCSLICEVPNLQIGPLRDFCLICEELVSEQVKKKMLS